MWVWVVVVLGGGFGCWCWFVGEGCVFLGAVFGFWGAVFGFWGAVCCAGIVFVVQGLCWVSTLSLSPDGDRGLVVSDMKPGSDDHHRLSS